MGFSTLIKLICGRSRAGKTTYSKQFEKVIHLDFCGGPLSCYDHALEKIADQQGDVIIEGVYNTAERRKALLNAYQGNDKKLCIWLDTPLNIIEERAKKSHMPVCIPTLFEPPTLDEGWDEIIIIRGDDNAECFGGERKT